MEFKIDVIDGGACDYFMLKDEGVAISLIRFRIPFAGNEGILAHHVESDGVAAMECDVFDKCCVRDLRLREGSGINDMSDDEICEFLESKIKTGV